MGEYVDGWVDGWTRSRKAPRPEPVDGGWYVATRSAREHGRFVLSDPTPERLAAIVDAGQPPRTGVKLPGDPEEWLPRFGEGWEPAFLDAYDIERDAAKQEFYTWVWNAIGDGS